MYKYIIRPFLFLFSPETSHRMVVILLKIPGVCFFMDLLYHYKNPLLQKTVFGLQFPNPVGLAAGFDKDGKFFDEIAHCGFGFIEVGTVTPRPQPGNDKPRLFRLTEDKALINRMGFNNDGVEALVERLKKRRNFKVIVGGNIGKNKLTSNENALADYEYCFEKLFDHVDYFVVNVSSPNTPGLRALQEKEPLKKILNRLMEMNKRMLEDRQKTANTKIPITRRPVASARPILLKIAPDLTNEQLDDIIEIIRETKLDGVVATNTTISRESLHTPNSALQAVGAGGLSGMPLNKRSTEVIKYLSEKSGKAFPIIASGGIHSAEDAIEKLNAGASLIQLYTGFIYEGPGLIRNICREIISK